MSITVEVSLLSGKTATVEAGPDEEVETLKRRAQAALGVGRGRLMDSAGRFLDPRAQIKDCEVQTADALTLHCSPVK